MQKIRRIAALIGVILLVGMYLLTLVFALIGSPASRNMLMAAIVCTVVIPVLIYAMQLLARVLAGTGAEDTGEDSDEGEGNKKEAH